MDWISDYDHLEEEFSSLASFEKEFKSTKWSIRKYRTFLSQINQLAVSSFIHHTIRILKAHVHPNKELLRFIKDVEKISNTHYKKNDPIKFGENGKDFEDEIIKTFAEWRKLNKINCSVNRIADLITENFVCERSYRTIVDKINKINTEH